MDQRENSSVGRSLARQGSVNVKFSDTNGGFGETALPSGPRRAVAGHKKAPGEPGAKAGREAGRSSDLGAALSEVAGAQAQAVEADEAGRVALVVPALHAFHGGDLVVVK